MPGWLLREELRRAAPGRPSAFTIGTFDGVHRGHRFLATMLQERAHTRDLACGVITLHPHPLTVVRPGSQVTYLTSLDERIELLSSLGFDVVAPVTFTSEVSQVGAEDFIALMVEELQLRFLLVGPDFALGRGREGSGERLEEGIAAARGVELEVAPAEEAQGHKIGSRDIRAGLAEGDVEHVQELLGRPYSLRGPVVHGAEVGRQLGFPTANLALAADRALPAFGIYAGCAQLGERRYRTAINVGIRPTVNTGEPIVEAYLLDFEGDLYGRELQVSFGKRLRGEQKFPDLEALKQQIARDVAETRAVIACDQP